VVVTERRPAHHFAQLVGAKRQVPVRRDPRVLLAQRPRSRVTGVDEDPSTYLCLAVVQLVKSAERHVNLPSDLQDLRSVTTNALGHGTDRKHISGDIFAYFTVASSGCPDQPGALVKQRHRQAIDL
jgi:hypothetical protein